MKVKKWYEKYNYVLMTEEFKYRIAENPSFSIDKHIDDLELYIEGEIDELERSFDGKYDEKLLKSFRKQKTFWGIYKRESTLQAIIDHEL